MRVSLAVLPAFIIVSVTSAAQAQTAPAAACNSPHAPGIVQHELMSGQRQRSYRLFVPAQYDGRTPLPLVLNLHGSGGNAAGQARTSGFEDVATSEGFAVASLQADGGRWNVPVNETLPDDVAYVSDVIDHVAARLCIDLARVYATGFSGGGRMSSRLGCRLSTRI